MRNIHAEVMCGRTVRILYLLNKFSVTDNGLAGFCGYVLLGRSFVAREVERREPMTTLIGLALGPDLIGMDHPAILNFLVDKIHAFLWCCGVLEAERDVFAGRIFLVECNDDPVA